MTKTEEARILQEWQQRGDALAGDLDLQRRSAMRLADRIVEAKRLWNARDAEQWAADVAAAKIRLNL